jgi:branched-chain amino acid transport system permease protein
MRKTVLSIIACIALLAIPLVITGNYYVRIANLALVFGLLAVSLNIILGYAGQVALGHAGLFGIGAYTAALISTGGSGGLFWVGFVAAGATAGIAGLVICIPTLRLKGHYFALATLGFGEIMRHIFFNWHEVTHGMDGIGNIPAPSVGFFAFNNDVRYYYLAGTILAIAVLLTYRIARSKYGRMFAAVRDAEMAAGTSGVDVPRLKITAFFISSVMAGFAGALYAHLIAFISPDAFSFEVTAQVLSMALIGGLGTAVGPVIGAAVITVLPELLRVSKAYYQLIYGAGIAAMIIFLPGGLLGLFKSRWAAWRGKSADAVTVIPDSPVTAPQYTEKAVVATPAPVAAPANPAVPRDVLLEVDNVTCRFGGLVALDSLTVNIERGTIHGLIGPNGAGKSTFINVVTGIYKPTAGQLRFGGTAIGGAYSWKIAALGLVRTYQNLRLFNTLSVMDNVLVGCRSARKAGWFGVMFNSRRAQDEEVALRAQAEEALRFAGLWHLRDHLVRTLPHGQQRMVEIARAFAMRPKLIMLDEPAAGINPAEVEELIRRMLRLRELGITILLIEHNMPLVMRVADQITVLNFGRKIGEGTPAEIRDNPEVINAYLGHGKTKKENSHATA